MLKQCFFFLQPLLNALVATGILTHLHVSHVVLENITQLILRAASSVLTRVSLVAQESQTQQTVCTVRKRFDLHHI